MIEETQPDEWIINWMWIFKESDQHCEGPLYVFDRGVKTGREVRCHGGSNGEPVWLGRVRLPEKFKYSNT